MSAHVAASAPNTAAQRRILIVDDDPATRRLYRFLFASSGYTVEEAEDGVEALEKLRELVTPVVITDMNMPRMDGMELVQEIRQHFPNVYTIMVTAFGASDTEKRALRAGAHQYLAKPFEFEELEQHVQAFFDTLSDASPFPR
jgi:two-component system, chemotaxis family, chemotaxis protein CheY